MQEYKIAVVANMSAGKSTFINALFGDDILPAYSAATTDCPVYIYSDNDPQNDKAIIEFSDDKDCVILEKDEVKEHIKLYAQKDTLDLDYKYKNVKKIDLHWDFKTLQNDDNNSLKFVIIDTPGPNNTDNFKNKHKEITKKIIFKEANMVIYLFDYGQLDCNFEVSEGNIWNLIMQRRKKDKSFEVLFVINKIDMAFEDNKKLSQVREAKTRDEFYQKINEFWHYHENKAKEKLHKTADMHGFKNAKIFTTSAYHQKLFQMKNISLDDEDELNTLIKLFKSVFKSNWEKELVDYLKINTIEDHTRLHLSNIEKLLNNKDEQPQKIINQNQNTASKSHKYCPEDKNFNTNKSPIKDKQVSATRSYRKLRLPKRSLKLKLYSRKLRSLRKKTQME
jgi:GTPase Era involved in 16S rRNA processing